MQRYQKKKRFDWFSEVFALPDLEIHSFNWFCSICYDYENSPNKNRKQSKQTEPDIDGASQDSKRHFIHVILALRNHKYYFDNSLFTWDFIIITFPDDISFYFSHGLFEE